MKNKYLVTVSVPTLMEEYEVYIPANEQVEKVRQLLLKAIQDLSDGAFPLDRWHPLINSEDGTIYQGNEIVRDVRIHNGTKLILF